MAHCGACHTSRNPPGAERQGARFAGADIDNWTAPALTAANPSSAESFTRYLEAGVGIYHGVAAGPMGAVHVGLRELPKSDIEAIGTYLGAGLPTPPADPAKIPAVAASLAAGRPDPAYRKDRGERLYLTACASCHYNSEKVVADRPELGIDTSTRLPHPTNLIEQLRYRDIGLDASS